MVKMYGERAVCACGETFKARDAIAAMWWASGHVASAHKRDL
jgi:hypothetical protein